MHEMALNNSKLNLGMKTIANKLKSFDIEFLPFIEEMNAKEAVIRECADAATMGRIKGMIFTHTLDIVSSTRLVWI